MKSLCRHFGVCGGCKKQSTSYQEQLREKEEFVKNLFLPLVCQNSRWYSIIGSQFPFRYRNKMEFTFSQNLKNERFLGLYGSKRRVVMLEECLLCPEWFEEALKETFDFWSSSDLLAYYPPKDQGSLRTLTLREAFHSKKKMALLTISGNPAFPVSDQQKQEFSHRLALKFPGISVVVRTQVIQKGIPTEMHEELFAGDLELQESLSIDVKNKKYALKFKIPPSAFFQPNTAQAEILYSRAFELLRARKEESILDLYSGTGTLSLFASFFAKEVVAIELQQDAVKSAIHNAHLNKIKNVHFYAGDVACVLKGLSFQADSIIVDPPRSGLDTHALQLLLKLFPKKILYISCNPASQQENIKILIQGGYEIESIQPVDQFPHTPHIENIVVLQAVAK